MMNKKELITATGLTVPTLDRWLKRGYYPKLKGETEAPAFVPAAYGDNGEPMFSENQADECKRRHSPKFNGNKNKIKGTSPKHKDNTDEQSTIGQHSDDSREVWDLIPTVDELNEVAADVDSESGTSIETVAAPVVDDGQSKKMPLVPKDFLPMTIAPNFDAIPQVLKDLPRFVCWQGQWVEKNGKKRKTKIPMTPKDGKLVKADITKPQNWLTFDEAISWYNRGLCSGIGFALTNTPPKVCCVDVDHCFTDGTLTDEAKAVIETCQNSFTEKSQSGDGIHVWFVDEQFPSEHGRKKGGVEVYAFNRFVALTCARVETSSKELLTVNGACRNVIAKFIDAEVDKPNLFDEPARSLDSIKVNINAPLSLDDRELVEYFRSDKCRSRDSKIFALFNGDKETYFKNTGKPFDDSVADFDLMLKILYYVGGSGTDTEIGQRVLKIFGQSELAKREKWQKRKDYQRCTLNAAFDFWSKNGREAFKSSKKTPTTAQALKEELRAVNQAIADFEKEALTACDALRNVEIFDSETVFSEKILQAAAKAKLCNKKAFSDFKNEIRKFGERNRDKKVGLRDWSDVLDDYFKEIEEQQSALTRKRNYLQGKLRSANFTAGKEFLEGVIIPEGFAISAAGVEKITEDDSFNICRRPVIISGKQFDTAEKNYKLTLSYYVVEENKWKHLPATEAANIVNHRKLVDLANKGLPVTSLSAIHLVDYLDAFKVANERNFSPEYVVPRCGWYNFGGKDYFIDPRRDCVFSDDDGKNIKVKVDDVRSDFAKHMKTVGSLDEWKLNAYLPAKKSPVARLIVAAAVAPILLDVLGERNFLLYIYAPTRAGKTTALCLGASAIGDEKIIRSFDATKNGLAGAAADVNDYAFLVDERQVADNYLKDQFNNLVYALANGIGRTKLNRDSTLKKTQDWRTIAIMTGETQMLSDNVTGGANTRLLTIKAPKEILSAADCKIIRDTIKANNGLVLPLVVDKVLEIGRKTLRKMFEEMIATFEAAFPEILPEYRRYMAVLTLADGLLNSVLFGDTVAVPDGKTIKPSDDAIINAAKIFPLIPTINEISDTQREKDFVRGIIAKNQNSFVGGYVKVERMKEFFGKLHDDDGFVYITVQFLKDACRNEGFDYRKLVADLIADGFFAPSTKIKKGCKKPLDTVQKKIGLSNATCYRIPQSVFDERE